LFRVSNVYEVRILVNTRTETSRETEHFEIKFLFDMFYTPYIN